MIAHARSGAQGVLLWHRLLNHPNIEVVPVDRVMTEAATEAYERFGKGYHPARLNFGDLFSYALAKTHNLPLLYKGNDFAHTDIVSVLSA
jgi:ribonuclease VapC